MSVVIAAVTHKEYDIPDDPLYLPLMAGSALMPEVPYGYTRDDTGDNISTSNRMYCELTGLYWMWKHCDADYIGLCHYRRYFALRKTPSISTTRAFEKSGSVFSKRIKKSEEQSGYAKLGHNEAGFGRCHILTAAEADLLVRDHEVILPAPRRYYIETNYSQYAHAHRESDLDTVREILAERHPSYLRAYDRRMSMRSGHRFNMFIMKRDILNEYCEWLFDILFELEKSCVFDDKYARVCGYVAERLLDVWLDANHISYAELPYIMTENEHLARKAVGLIIRKINAISTPGKERGYFRFHREN